MKQVFFLLVAISTVTACNNQTTNNGKTDSSPVTTTSSEAPSSVAMTGNCSSLYLFRKGTKIEAASYDAAGKEVSRQQSTVSDVSNDAGRTVATVEMKSSVGGKDEKTFTGKYSCDGKNLYADLTSLFASMDKKGATVEGDPIIFPINLKEGEQLPEASYAITVNQGGRKMKITSFIKNRNIEGKEKITTSAGTFDCYKITADVEANVEMEGMDEKMKEMMENMKRTMPKQRFVMYFDPAVSIVKVEMYSGDKLTSRNEVVSIQ